MLRRTLASAALNAALLAADLVLLTLFLNPAVAPRREAGSLLVALFLPYCAAATLALLLLGAAGSLFRWWPASLRPPLQGLPWFTSFAFLTVSALAGLYWLNLETYRSSLPVESDRALAFAAASLGACALMLAAVALNALAYPHKARGASAALVVLGASASLVVPLALQPSPSAASPALPLATEPIRPLRRVVLIGIDGLSEDFVLEGAQRGNLPAFGRLLREGAHGSLRSLEPTEGPPLWTSIVTGLLPRDHGVKSFASYRLPGSATVYELLPKGALVGLLERAGLVTRSPVTAAARKRQALWNAANAFGIQAGVVRLWATHPAQRVQGFMLSNYFHLLHGNPQQAALSVFPPATAPLAASRAVSAAGVDPALVSRFVDLSVELADDPLDWRHELVERALAPDLTYRRAGTALRAAYDPPLFATYFYGLDVVRHAFLRFARPDHFGNVSDSEVRRYGAVVDRYAALLSEWVGEEEQALRPNEVLLVVSSYGMRPVSWWRSALSAFAGGFPTSGTHVPDGFLAAAGRGIRQGAVLEQASILDVAPTILYLMGLPVARDMEGRVLTEILDPDFARAHPVTFIPSYESLAVISTPGPAPLDLPPLPDEMP